MGWQADRWGVAYGVTTERMDDGGLGEAGGAH